MDWFLFSYFDQLRAGRNRAIISRPTAMQINVSIRILIGDVFTPRNPERVRLRVRVWFLG
jgi:hypothetical protein